MTRIEAWLRRHPFFGRAFPAPEPPIKGIVSAVASSSSTINPGQKKLSKKIEGAMALAVADCYARGISAPEEIKAAMLAARARVKEANRGDNGNG